MFQKAKKDSTRTVTDVVNSTPGAIECDVGKLGTLLIRILDKTMSWQSSAITGYVSSLHKRKKDETPAQVQECIDSHYLNLVTGTGGATGGSVVLPDVGTTMGLAAVTGESLLFLEASTWYTPASVTLRNIDITDSQRRRTLILAAMSGSEGTAIMASLLGEESLRKQTKTSVNSLPPRLGVPQLGAVSRLLIRRARKRLMKNARLAIIGKILSFGIGAVVGASANRKLGGIPIRSIRASLDSPPQDWSDFERKPPAKPNTSEDSKKDSKSSRFSIPSALKWPKKKKNK